MSYTTTNGPDSDEGDDGVDRGITWSLFIQRLLGDEHERFKTLDSKGSALVTGSGTLVTLILAIGALTINRTGFRPNLAAVILALVGLLFFVLAASLGILTTRTMKYRVIKAASLEEIRTNDRFWTAKERAARRLILKFDIRTIESMRCVNKKKAKIITAGQVAQVAGVLALAGAAGVALLSA